MATTRSADFRRAVRLGSGPRPRWPAVVLAAVVDQVLAAPTRDQRQSIAACEIKHRVAALTGPAGTLRSGVLDVMRLSALLQDCRGQRRGAGRGSRNDRLRVRWRGDGGGQHVLGQGQHNRPCPARHRKRRMPGRCTRECARGCRSQRPTWPAARTSRGNQTSWNPSRSRASRATWPMNRIIGVESWNAV